MPAKNRTYTKVEDDLIRQVYSERDVNGNKYPDVTRLVSMLDRDYKSIQTRARRLGLTNPTRVGYRKGSRWTVDPKTGCWNWNLALSESGYAMCSSERAKYGTIRAHRQNYIEKYGKIPDGLQLDHLCRNRRCVNPDHLEPVTSKENTHRGDGVKVNDKIVNEIRKMKNKRDSGELTYAQIGAMFSIGASAVFKILQNLTWS